MSVTEEEIIVASIIACCCGLSILGANYIIYKYIKQNCNKPNKTKIKPSRHQIKHEILKFVNTIILWIAITDLIDYTSELLGSGALLAGYWDGSKNWICLIQAVGTHIGSVSSIAWTVASSWILHQIIRLPQSVFEANIQNNLNRIRCLMHITIWIITLISILPPLILDLYGPAQGHCWIINEGIGKLLRWILFYIPAWIGTFYMIYVYFMLLRFETTSSQENLTASLIIKNIRYFPVVLVICYIPATSKRIYDLIVHKDDKDENVEFIFQCAMYAGLMLVGFFDGILFGYLLFSGIQTTESGESDENIDDENDTTPLNTSITIPKESDGQDYKYSHLESHQQNIQTGQDDNDDDIEMCVKPKQNSNDMVTIVYVSEIRSSQKTLSTSDGVEYDHSHLNSNQDNCIKDVRSREHIYKYYTEIGVKM